MKNELEMVKTLFRVNENVKAMEYAETVGITDEQLEVVFNEYLDELSAKNEKVQEKSEIELKVETMKKPSKEEALYSMQALMITPSSFICLFLCALAKIRNATTSSQSVHQSVPKINFRILNLQLIKIPFFRFFLPLTCVFSLFFNQFFNAEIFARKIICAQ